MDEAWTRPASVYGLVGQLLALRLREQTHEASPAQRSDGAMS